MLDSIVLNVRKNNNICTWYYDSNNVYLHYCFKGTCDFYYVYMQPSSRFNVSALEIQSFCPCCVVINFVCDLTMCDSRQNQHEHIYKMHMHYTNLFLIETHTI